MFGPMLLARLALASLIFATIAIAPGGVAQAQGTVEVPPIPDPVAVTLNPNTTALVLSDFMNQNCANLPSCVVAMGPMSRLLAQARQSGVLVLYTVAGGLAPSGWMPEVAPLPSETVFIRPAVGEGNWWGEGVEEALTSHGIETVILAGSQAAGIILHGTFQASLLDGYTVVAPVDGMPSPTDFRLIYTEFHVLNLPGGRQNPDNEPLSPGAVTLSRSDLITFR